MAGGVDDERVSVEAGEHDGVFGAEIVGGERAGLPAEAIVGGGEILGERQLGLEVDSGVGEMLAPSGPHRFSVLLIKVSAVGEEGGGEEDVSSDGRHLRFERSTSSFPANSFRSETVEERDRPVDSSLHPFHLVLDRLRLADEERVFLLVRGDSVLQFCDHRDHVRRLALRLSRLILQILDFLPQRSDSIQNVRVVNLSDHPFAQRSARPRSAIDGLEREGGEREEFRLHLLPQLTRHRMSGIEIDDAGNEVVSSNNTLHRLPSVDLESEDRAYRLHRDLDGVGRVGHRSDFGQLLLLDRLHRSLRVLDRGSSLGELSHHDGASFGNLLLLALERSLNFDRVEFLLLSVLLILDHSLELVVRFNVLVLELRPLDREALAELLDLNDGRAEFVESDVEMSLLLLELVSLLVEDPDVLIDEVEVVARRDEVGSTLSTSEFCIRFVHRGVDKDEGVDDSSSVHGR